MSRFEVHSHTDYSNIRLLDCINKIEKLTYRAIENGLSGICITDHETLAGHMEANLLAQDILKEHPDFKLALGNEIYLINNRESGQKYYHFILIAKNKDGHKALRELSSNAWMNSYHDRGMERVPTLKCELQKILYKYPNSLIATTACLGGELSTNTLKLINCEKVGDENGAIEAHNNIVNFMCWCKEIFGEDFYIEVAPGCSADQKKVNKRLVSIAKAFDVKMVIGCDAHYLKKEDRFVHKSYLNSKGGEREVDEFYEFSYLQTEEEIVKHLNESIPDVYDELVKNSEEIYNKIENYSLSHKQTIPKVEVKDYPKENFDEVEDGKKFIEKYPTLASMHNSENKVERYWVNECCNKLAFLGKYNDEYLSRLEEEADIKRTIGEKLETNMFAYPVTLQHYVDMFWECGSMVGAGRGSSCSGLNHYLLGITQLDPIEWDLPFFRYLNKERQELGDIDLDLCPSKRPEILRRIKNERSRNFISNIDECSRRNLGCTLIATFGTEGTRSTILTACRGYRSEEYTDGIDVDTAQYLSTLIPSERGFLWSLKDALYGNVDKDRKPITLFINEVNKYPGLIEIMEGIEGLINKRSSHASGVILFDEDPYEFGCFMKTPNGEIITQYDLHMCEAAGMTKYDFLVTEVQDKLVQTIKLLQENEEIEKDLTLREIYDKYFHPNILPIKDEKIWKAIQNNEILNIFQFDSDVGSQAAKKIKPKNIQELADANGLMRLMAAEKGAETPMEKYIRYKNNIDLWYQEMQNWGLTTDEMKILEPYFLSSYGVPPSQEQLMKMLMDKDICNFSIAEANDARKIVGKKLIAKVPALHEKVISRAKNEKFGEYVWKFGLGPQMSYSFSIIHALAYSFIGFQTAFIATKWNPIYWNCACLIVNSGSLEDNSTEEIVGIYEPEHQDLAEGVTFEDLPDRSGKIKKTSSTDYAKMATALGQIISRGINVSLVDINKSDYSFKPDVENNKILFGLKALSGVGDPIIEDIKRGRPYASIRDFMNRCPLSKTAMISLIKAGAFDNLDNWEELTKRESRYGVMAYYLSIVSSPKKKLTLSNFNGLLEKGLVPSELDFETKVFHFNKYLKTRKYKEYFLLDEEYAYNFYEKNFDLDKLTIIDGMAAIGQKVWDKIYQSVMDEARDWLKSNEKEILFKYNQILFKESWDKYAEGSLADWEMESLCFYYHEHPLAKVDTSKYGIEDFFNLSPEPDIDYFFKRNGREIPIYNTHIIIGTVISKNDNKSSIALLTTNGVVTVKFTKEYYAMFGRQLSEKQADGTKKVVEKGWFKRGTKLMLTGIRREDMFITKTYKNTLTHQIYKILNVNEDGKIILTHDRYNSEGVV